MGAGELLGVCKLLEDPAVRLRQSKLTLLGRWGALCRCSPAVWLPTIELWPDNLTQIMDRPVWVDQRAPGSVPCTLLDAIPAG